LQVHFYSIKFKNAVFLLEWRTIK